MEHAVYLQGIKAALRRRGIPYTELARRLKMSESGVKKMLNAKDISFRRVLQICDVLGILPGQLFSSTEQTAIPEVTFTAAQQDALIKSRLLLAVYWRFVIEKRTPAEIEKLEKASPGEIKKALHRLAALDLIQQSRGQFRPLNSGKFRWSDNSRLAKFLNREWSELTLNRALRTGTSTETMHRLSVLRLSGESSLRLRQSLAQVLDEAARVSEREELSLAPSALQNCSVLVAAVQKGVLDGDVS